MPRLSVIPAVLVTAFLPASLGAQDASNDQNPVSTGDRYITLSTAGDHEGLVALWREDPDAAVPVIDRDLEGSLALWEEGGEAKRAEIDSLIARGIAGAHAAVEATGRRRILDYVTSFAGWTDEQKVTFRGGQGACREGSQALRDGNRQAALAKAGECRALAEPLGDWWGTAMGLRLEGSALSGTGEEERAVTAFSRARLIFRELGLTSSALRIEVDLAGLLIELGRRTRAEAIILDGRDTADRLGLADLALRFRELEEELGS